MKNKLFFSGIIVLITSIVIGVLGTLWSIYNSFDFLVKNETASIDQVGFGITNAVVFSVITIVGAAIGIILIIISAIRLRKK